MTVLRRTHRRATAITAVVLTIASSLALAGPAVAGPSDPLYLSVTKTVDNPTPDPGESFVYTIRVTCSEASCLDAQLDDALPAELDGYALQSAVFSPSASTIPRTVQWTVDGTPGPTAPSVVTANTSLHVDFTGAVTAPSGTGLQNGQTFTVLLTLSVPTDLPPGTSVITNTASTVATNSSDSSDQATITVTMPESIGVTASKSWSPASQGFQEGASSSVSLSATSESNIPLDSLVIQDPQTAPDGAATLHSSNPFTLKDFAGFGAFTMPSGASSVTVDAYVFQAGSWSWVPGIAGATPDLPAGVADAEVGGLRLTFDGVIGPGATATVAVNLSQRANDRLGADLSTATHSVTNVMVATASAAGHAPVSDTASAPHTITPALVAAATSKDISPASIAAGDSATGTIVATNDSDVGVAELRAADLAYFTNDITFGGFTSGIAWPSGTQAASVVYHPLAGGADETASFADGATPVAPSAPVSGFEVVFTSASGMIAAGATTAIHFGIDTTEAAIGSGSSLVTSNSVTTTVRALNGVTDSASDTAPLTLLTPAITLTQTKTILPAGPAQPGDRVVVALQNHMTTTSDYVTATQIVAEDSWSGTQAFWDAFRLESLAPSMVPADTQLTISVLGPDKITWVDIAVLAPQGSPHAAELDAGALAAAVASAVASSYTVSDVTGVRFTYDNAGGFAGDTTVTPYVVARANATLRESGLPTAPSPSVSVNYDNTASAGSTGVTGSGTPLSATAGDIGTAAVIGADGVGTAAIDKAWSQATVPAQSDGQRFTTLSWSVDEGFQTVTIADAQDATDPTATAFSAFNLVSIPAIPASGTPFSNGWYLRYDSIDVIQLWISGAWVTVPAPGGGWINNGAFVGYTLTGSESANATGVRIVMSENTAARNAATTAGGSFDPYAPTVGSGVGASASARQFTLNWQLRDKTRVADAWITEDLVYNATDPGLVNNTVTLAATPLGGGADVTAAASDDILITNPGPAVTITKTVTPSTRLIVPVAGSDASLYPTERFTVVARNNSTMAASYVRVMDSPGCTDVAPIVDCESAGTAAGAVADPFDTGLDWLGGTGMGNPFDRFDLRDVTISASIPAQVDLNASTVWLLHYSAGTYSTTSHSATAVNAMNAASLADVVGISVTFQDTDPATDGGSITSSNSLTVTLDTKLRATYRVSGDDLTLAANVTENVLNRAFAQSYDPIVNDGVQDGALASANARITGGDINVGATKSVSPSVLTKPRRGDVVTVTLGANQGTAPTSTLAPAEVRLTDDVTSSPEFWDAFDFTGLGTITPPSGADRVSVSVYGPFGSAGSMAWVSSTATPIASATVPVTASQYSSIQGVKFAFSRADGEFFSQTIPAASWSTTAVFTAQLRSTYRSGGAAVELNGTVHNTVTTVSDRLNGESSVERTASASIILSAGTFQIKVNKLANEGTRTATAGNSVPWDLTFTNAGTGYLTITELRDTLPASLVYLGDTAPVYTPDGSGMLGEPSQITQVGSDLIFTWPNDDRTMAPGETFSVRIMLELEPGLSTGDHATNTMTVVTEETLASCANTVPSGSVTSAWSSDPTTCGTTDYVTPAAGPNLFTVKGVKGASAGAVNPVNPAQPCTPSLNATGGSYYRAPCAANSVIGGTDSWVLRAQNAGTTGLAEMVVFDALPAPGDAYLISGLARGSEYRPQMLDDLDVTAPAGTGYTVEVTTTPQACQGTWGGLETHEPCEQHGEVWVAADGSTDWAQVTAFRLIVDFTGTAAGRLAPAEFIDVTFSTINVPATADDATGVPLTVPMGDVYAWNQFGVKYLDTGASSYRKIAPARMGLHLSSGSVTVTKVLAGPFAYEAPGHYDVSMACTVDGETVDMASSAVVSLLRTAAFTATVPGIPEGSTCVLTEPDNRGATGTAFAGASVITLGDVSASVEIGTGASTVTLTNYFGHTLAFTGAGSWRATTGLAALAACAGVGLVLLSRRMRAW